MAGIHTTMGLPKRPMRVFGHYALVYITQGRGTLQDAQGLYRQVQAGDLIFIFPEIGHTYGPADGQFWDEIWIAFDGPVFDLWRDSKHLDDANPILHLEPVDFWTRQLTDVVWSVPDLGKESALVRVCRLQQFIADARKHASFRNSTNNHTAWLAQAKQLLESSGAQKPSYHDIAAQLGISYDGFRKRFTKEMGISPDRHYNRYRMSQVCELLVSEQLALREIAYRLGFSDEYHLSKRFKQMIGMSPSEFRNFFLLRE